MSERIYREGRRRVRSSLEVHNPWGWMALQRRDITVGAGVVARYDPELGMAKRLTLNNPPDDLQFAVWLLNAEKGEHVEALLYGLDSGHPHLDVYVHLQGALADAQLICDLKHTFFGARLGVGLDHVSKRDREDKKWVRIELSYCPTHDPSVARYLEAKEAHATP